MSTKLAHQTQKTAGIGNGMRTATVTAVSPVTISINGGEFSSGVGVLDSYVPAVGDVVAVFRQDSSWLILGATGVSLGPQPRATLTGTTPVNVAGVDSIIIPVTFSLVFPAPPIVVANLNTVSGNARSWTTKTFGASATGASLWFESATATAATFTGVGEWVATAQS